MSTKPKMYCKDNRYVGNELTYGKEYAIYNEISETYCVKNDLGEYDTYGKQRFTFIKPLGISNDEMAAKNK